VNGASTPDTAEQMRLGAFRARTVKRLDEIVTTQSAWNEAYEVASALYKRAALDQALGAIKAAQPLPCAISFGDLRVRVEQTRENAENLIQEGEKILLQARSTFDYKSAVRLALDAASKFTQAKDLNLDNKAAPQKLQEARDLADTLSGVDKHDVMILSNPGGARVTLKGEDSDRVCPSTPCKFRVDAVYFVSTGGAFLDSKRLLRPLVAVVEKPGYRPVEQPITKSGQWKGSRPGGKVLIDFYYLSQTKFEVELAALR
jgi:hypothetical protein